LLRTHSGGGEFGKLENHKGTLVHFLQG
jgi:hypothetical protein